MANPTEIELKLSLPPAQAGALRAHRALQPHVLPDGEKDAAAPPRATRLVNHYFDTDDRLLAKNGMALRLRCANGQWFQTLKTSDESAGALSTRGEWEMPVAGPKLDLAQLRGTPLSKLDIASKARRSRGTPVAPGTRLARVFTVTFRRETWQLRLERGTEAELVLDTGTIAVGAGRKRRTEPVSEVEIELKHGDPDAVLKFAQRLARDIALVPLPLSKAERGHALAEARATAPVKPKMPKAKPDESAAAHLAQVVGACQHALLINAHGFAAAKGRDAGGDSTADSRENARADTATAPSGGKPGGKSDRDMGIESDYAEFVHQARVAVRYLRSAVRAHRSLIGRRRADAINAGLRKTGQEFGAARDWAVFAEETLTRIEPIVAIDGDGLAAMRALRAAATGHRAAADDELRHYLASTDFAQAALKTERFVIKLRSRDAAPVGGIAPRLLDRQHSRVVDLARFIATLDAGERHQLRIEVKRLRYTFEFFIDLYDEERVKPYRRALSDLQDELGELNDGAVAVTLLADLDAQGAADAGDAAAGAALAHRRVAEWFEARVQKKLPVIASLSVRLELAVRPWAE